MTGSFCAKDQLNGSSQTLASDAATPDAIALVEELRTCRSIAGRCAFVLGPARSGTTILAQMINASSRAFITTEAFYCLAENHTDFRRWYNDQHRRFENQVSKTSYAPNFGYSGEHEWWKWLARAAEHFDVVGDKMAFADAHPQIIDPARLMEFFEARFFGSKFLFIFRDPVQSVLSAVDLWNRDPVALVLGWAHVVKLWADFIRIFPNTMTVLLEELDRSKIAAIGDFLDLDLSESAKLLDPREQRRHDPEQSGREEFTRRITPLLQMIFGEIKESITMERVFLQADQKRARLDEPRHLLGSGRPEIAVVSTPVGRAWNLAHRLMSDLEDEHRP